MACIWARDGCQTLLLPAILCCAFWAMVALSRACIKAGGALGSTGQGKCPACAVCVQQVWCQNFIASMSHIKGKEVANSPEVYWGQHDPDVCQKWLRPEPVMYSKDALGTKPLCDAKLLLTWSHIAGALLAQLDLWPW